MAVDELKPLGIHRKILRKFECLISQGGNFLPKLGMSHSRGLIILAFLSTVCSSMVVSKVSLRRLPLVKRFALRNVASTIKIDNI